MAEDNQTMSGFAALRAAEEEAKRNKKTRDVDRENDEMMGRSADSDTEDEMRDDDII